MVKASKVKIGASLRVRLGGLVIARARAIGWTIA